MLKKKSVVNLSKSFLRINTSRGHCFALLRSPAGLSRYPITRGSVETSRTAVRGVSNRPRYSSGARSLYPWRAVSPAHRPRSIIFRNAAENCFEAILSRFVKKAIWNKRSGKCFTDEFERLWKEEAIERKTNYCTNKKGIELLDWQKKTLWIFLMILSTKGLENINKYWALTLHISDEKSPSTNI